MGLQNLFPGFEGKSISKVCVNTYSKARFFKLNIKKLRMKLMRDEELQEKVWLAVAHRVVFLNQEKFPVFKLWAAPAIRSFIASNTRYMTANEGETIELDKGAILLQGTLRRVDSDEEFTAVDLIAKSVSFGGEESENYNYVVVSIEQVVLLEYQLYDLPVHEILNSALGSEHKIEEESDEDAFKHMLTRMQTQNMFRQHHTHNMLS